MNLFTSMIDVTGEAMSVSPVATALLALIVGLIVGLTLGGWLTNAAYADRRMRVGYPMTDAESMAVLACVLEQVGDSVEVPYAYLDKADDLTVWIERDEDRSRLILDAERGAWR